MTFSDTEMKELGRSTQRNTTTQDGWSIPLSMSTEDVRSLYGERVWTHTDAVKCANLKTKIQSEIIEKEITETQT